MCNLHWCYTWTLLLSANQNRVIFSCILLGLKSYVWFSSKLKERAARVRFEIGSMISDQNCTTRSSIATLLDPFWNHWLSLRCDWLSVVRFIPESRFFALNRIFFSANENGTVKQTNQSDFKAFLTNQSHCRKMKDKKAIVWQIWLLNCVISKWI